MLIYSGNFYSSMSSYTRYKSSFGCDFIILLYLISLRKTVPYWESICFCFNTIMKYNRICKFWICKFALILGTICTFKIYFESPVDFCSVREWKSIITVTVRNYAYNYLTIFVLANSILNWDLLFQGVTAWPCYWSAIRHRSACTVSTWRTREFRRRDEENCWCHFGWSPRQHRS